MKITIERDDGTKIILEGPCAEIEAAKLLGIPLAVNPIPLTFPGTGTAPSWPDTTWTMLSWEASL